MLRVCFGAALWALLMASFLYLGFQWNRQRHRQAALNYLRARNAKVDADHQEQAWYSLAPLLGRDSLLRVHSIRFDESGAVDADLAQIAAFEELAELCLRNGDISNDAAASLNQLQNLESLDLAGTQFGDAGLAQLHFPKIKSVDLSRSWISDAGITRLCDWHSLTRVHLHSVSGSDLAFSRLAQLPRLAELDLSHTSAAAETLRGFSAHPHLSILRLNGCPITDEHLEPLAENQALASLSLEGTDVGDVGISRLANCNALVKLVLNSTRVTDRVLQALRPMQNLLKIDAENTEVSRAALEQFHDRLNKPRKPIPLPGAGLLAPHPLNVCEVR